MKWPGRDRVFLLYLGTMMLPGLVMMIPNYQIMIRLGLVDTYLGLIIPAAFSAFGTFLLRQFMLSIPSSLDEAARIDGASTWKTFWRITFPLLLPTTVAALMMTTIASLQTFAQIYVMTQGGPGDSSRTIVYHLFETAMEFNWLGRASAMAVVLLAIVMFITVMQWTLLQRRSMRAYE